MYGIIYIYNTYLCRQISQIGVSVDFFIDGQQSKTERGSDGDDEKCFSMSSPSAREQFKV